MAIRVFHVIAGESGWIPEAVMLRLISRFVRDESAATAIEYALIAAGISLAIIATVQNLGSTLGGRYTAVSVALQ